MNLDKYLKNYHSPIQSALAAIPVQPAKPTSHRCVSCGDDTPLKSGEEIYDRVTKRNQLFCFDCLNMTTTVRRQNRR